MTDVCENCAARNAQLDQMQASLGYLEQVARLVIEGIQSMAHATGPQAMMLKAMGMPVDAMNAGVQLAAQQRYGR